MESDSKTLLCPACKRVLPLTDFAYIPVDERCHACVPRDQAMALWDLKQKQAGQTIARILEEARNCAELLGPRAERIAGLVDEEVQRTRGVVRTHVGAMGWNAPGQPPCCSITASISRWVAASVALPRS